MSKGRKELYCPVCMADGQRSYLGTIDGEYFRAPPCKCGFQIELTLKRRVPRNVDRIEIRT